MTRKTAAPTFTRKLRMAMIGGGGPGSFIGKVHMRSALMDGTREVVAGVLRSDPAASLEAAKAIGIQGYPDVGSLLADYRAGKLELDYACIVTPNHAHYEPAKACLEAGLPLLCEKPLAFTVPQAEELARLARRKKVPFVLAATYTGHPMMMFARELVLSGGIGEVRKVEAWYTQGWLATRLEDTGQQQASWRCDPKRAGISNCGGDIGTHAFLAATWVTGLKVTKVSARLNRFGAHRPLDDDFNAFGEFSNGGMLLVHASQIAIGHKNDHGFRIHGTKASVEWYQEQAERLQVRYPDHDRDYWIGMNPPGFTENVRSYLRAPAGHHEDFFEAMANLHTSLERQIRIRNGEKGIPPPFPHPSYDDGVAAMRFVSAAVRSSKAKGAWTRT